MYYCQHNLLKNLYKNKVVDPREKRFCAKFESLVSILGHGGGRQEGDRKWAGRGEFGFFLQGGGEALFAPGGGGGVGYRKIAKRAPKMHFL